MPADIRSFFGGKAGAPMNVSTTNAVKEGVQAVRKRRRRKIVDDSDDEEGIQPKSPIPKVRPVKQGLREEAVTQGEPTSTSDYFASSMKKTRQVRDRTTRRDARSDDMVVNGHIEKDPAKAERTLEITRSSPIRQDQLQCAKGNTADDQANPLEDEDGLGGDDIFAAIYGKSGRLGDDYVEERSGSDLDGLVVKPTLGVWEEPKRKTIHRPKDVDIEMDDIPKASRTERKRKSEVLLDRDKGHDPVDKKKRPTPKKQKSTLIEDRPGSKEIQEILDSIPIVRPPSPPLSSGPPKVFNFAQQAQRSQTPLAAETKDIPVGAENCLAGLSFVFTGILGTLGREEGQSLVKRYGGKVTGGPSSKTSYVILGNDAGPKKLETIRKFEIKTINEDGLYELIRRLPANGGDGKAAMQYRAKKKAEEEKIRALAAEIDLEEKKAVRTPSGSNPEVTKRSQVASSPILSKIDDRLWTTKYAPTSLNMLCGNKTAVEKLQTWLRNWRRNAEKNFKQPGKEGSGIYRAVMIYGPPGIGKTTAAHLVSNFEGYDVVETNASDTRSKKLLESSLLGVLDTTSLQGYFSGEGKKIESERKRLVLIMDEVDGMSAGDRGGVGALAAVAKKTRIPLILICNDRKLPKMKPFDHVTYELPFRRPTAEQIRARLSTICFREDLKIPPQVLDSLIEGAHADIRQVINMLSTVKLDQQHLNYDEGKEMSKAWEKHVVLKPWDIISQILSSQMFSPGSKATLNDKIELYFNDHELSYLMLHENYLKTNPVLASRYQGKERKLKLLELSDNAATSISDGDLVDRMIHGTQQQWSLMPVHAAFSFVHPASFTFGNMNDRPSFTSWLGQNSKQGKLGRYVKEIQAHMRLRASGDRDEIRQQYLPALWDKLIRRLMDDGKDNIEDIIDLMDSYFLTREDWDAILELGLGPMDESSVKIETQAKATFTRRYNQRSHPVPFMKVSSVIAPKGLPKVKPDIEDAIDESDEGEILEDDIKEGGESEELDLKKDMYVKAPKKPAAHKGAVRRAKKTAKGEEDNDDFTDDGVKPKRGRGHKSKRKS